MVGDTVTSKLVEGIVGQKATNAPTFPIVGVVKSSDQTNNVFGRSFVLNSDGTLSAGAVASGGLIILGNPKNAPMESPLSTPLGYLPNGNVGEFLKMGEIFVSLLSNAGNVGDVVQASATTGELKACAVGDAADTGFVKFNNAVITKKYTTSNLFVVSIQ